jgi:hypothetical protein
MIAKGQSWGRTAHYHRGGMFLGLWLATLGLAVAWIGGCQGPGATTAAAPAGQQEPPVAVSAPSQAGEQAAPADRMEPVEVAQPTTGRISRRGPRIKLETEVCDLGEVGIDSKLTGAFKFTNTGNAPLRITMVRGCCGVTLSGVETGQVYAPGASGTLEFEYRALSVPNPAVVRMLYLQTNDPTHSMVSLTIKAAIVRRVDFKPASLSQLRLKTPNAGCPDITLTSLDGRPFAITGIEATGDTITADFDPDAKATRFVLKPKVDMARLEQNMRGRISISLTHPECGSVEIQYDALPEFDMSTSQIMMFNLRPGQAVQREFSIANNYGEAFEIESVASKKGSIKLLGQTKVGSGYRLQVEIVPPPKSGDIMVTDLLEIRIKDGRTLSIPFKGFYEER